jgi:hypothetical protein
MVAFKTASIPGRGGNMPVIARFYGITVQMFMREHGVPHVHAVYAEYELVIGIDTLEVLSGSAPGRVKSMMLEWMELHQAELLDNWQRCRRHELPRPVAPLD